MIGFLTTLGLVYGPVVLAALALFYALRLRSGKHDTVLTFQPFGILGISFPIKNIALARICLTVTALGLLFVYAFYDYSGLFPSHLQMEVFFDEAGVGRRLHEVFNPSDMRELGIPVQYALYRKQYFGLLDSEVREVLGSEFFSIINGNIHSNGETSFIVRKVDIWQRYYIEESKGELTHTLDAPHLPRREFFTLFEKLPSADDYFSTSVWDLLRRGSILIKPHFKQLLAENRTSRTISFNVAVVGITKVGVFPWPHFSPTIYCADLPNAGLIPVAYAIYR